LCVLGNADLRKNQRIVLETINRISEEHRFNEVVNQLQEEGYNIRGFYHTSAWQTQWRHVIEEQLLLFDGKRVNAMKYNDYDSNNTDVIPWDEDHWGVSLLSAVDKMILTVASSTKNDYRDITEAVRNLNLSHSDKILTRYNATIPRLGTLSMSNSKRNSFLSSSAAQVLSEGEFSSMESIYDYCKTEQQHNRKSIVFYVHSKGGCCTRGNGETNVAHWRELMNAFVIEFPSICMRALLEGYSTCGALYTTKPSPAYSGNFWWARCDHISMLPRPMDRFNCIDPEYFLFNITEDLALLKEYTHHCAYNTYSSGINHYATECNRVEYIEGIYDSVVGREISHTYSNQQNHTDSMNKCNSWRLKQSLSNDATVIEV
jgi:hypothetical protein